MKLIVGLGNPGTKYEWTWHNIGFLVLDAFAQDQPSFQGYREKDRALVAQLTIHDSKVWLMKPQTYMNLSGEAVGAFVRYHGILPRETMVVHDEIDLEPGRVQIKKGGGSAGHNGLESIFQHWEKDFYRLRMGVGKPTEMSAADFVLRHVSKTEMMPLVEAGKKALEVVLDKGVDKAVGLVNTRPKK